MHPDNEHILAIFKEERTRGIQMLFESYYRPLVLCADEILKNIPAAEDIVQDLFVRLWEDDYLLKITASVLPSYLYTAVRNASKSALSRVDILRNKDGLEHHDVSIEAVIGVDEEKMDRVIREMEQLPERTRQAMECVMLQGMKYQEAADKLQVSINTIKFLLKEGVRRLREKFSSPEELILLFYLCYKLNRNEIPFD